MFPINNAITNFKRTAITFNKIILIINDNGTYQLCIKSTFISVAKQTSIIDNNLEICIKTTELFTNFSNELLINPKYIL